MGKACGTTVYVGQVYLYCSVHCIALHLTALIFANTGMCAHISVFIIDLEGTANSAEFPSKHSFIWQVCLNRDTS